MAFRKADRDVFAEMARRLHGASFDVKRFCGGHAPQLAFMRSRHQWSHVMCARQSGKTWSCDGLLAENAIAKRGSTNLFLGLKGTGVRISNWVPVWRREICGFAGIPESWHNDTQMLTTFPGGSRVMFAGTDDLSNIKKYLGNRLDNGTVIIDECQDQPREVLRYIIRQLLPPMMTPTTRIVLAGVLPDVPAGLFFELAHPAPLDGGTCDCKGFHHFEWGRAANVHTPEAMDQLMAYMEQHQLKVDDPQIQRDWYMKRVWDAMATAYRYRQAINGYVAIAPEWLDRYDWEHGTAFAAIPHPGITNFTFGIDPGGGDRTSITGWGWGEHTHEIQHVFEWCTPRDTHVPLSEIASTLGIAVQHYPTSDIYWDPGSGSLEIDTFGTDYGIPLVRAANKSDFPGQVRRVNDLLTKAWLQVMTGSALEEDYTRARFDQTARAAGQWKWSSQWHPDPSESGRYGLAGYWASYTEPEVPKSHEEQRREAVKKKQVRAQARAAGQSLPQEIEEKLFEGDEEFIDLESLLG